MLKGQVRHAAVRWLTERADKGGVLYISTFTNDGPKTVLDVLKEKHPDPAQSSAEAFLSCSELPPLIDVDITDSHVEKATLQIQGSAGPGGSTASHWQHFLLCYEAHSAKLHDAVAELSRYLANSIVEWSDIRALMSSCLVALNKCPGVRPIAIGEIPRRILCKVIARATRDDITDLSGVDQLCSGLKSGIEGSVHAIRELYEENHSAGWGLLLVDARNAFNFIEQGRCPLELSYSIVSLFPILIYGYPSLTLQVSTKSEALYSKEGVGQGDPLSMLMYASALKPLIQSLSNPTTWIQNWYADD